MTDDPDDFSKLKESADEAQAELGGVIWPKSPAISPENQLKNHKRFWAGWHIVWIIIVAILIATVINSIYLALNGENQFPQMSVSGAAQYFNNNYWANYFTPGSGPAGLSGLYGMIASTIALVIIIIVLMKLPKDRDPDDGFIP